MKDSNVIVSPYIVPMEEFTKNPKLITKDVRGISMWMQWHGVTSENKEVPDAQFLFPI